MVSLASVGHFTSSPYTVVPQTDEDNDCFGKMISNISDVFHRIIASLDNCFRSFFQNFTGETQSSTMAVSPITEMANPTVESLLQRIHSCQATQRLYRSAEKALQDLKGRSLQLKLVPLQEVPFGGACDYNKGEILVASCKSANEAFSTFIFELANMTQCAKFQAVHDRAVRGKASREEYTVQMEKIEYDSTKIHIDVINEACIQEGKNWFSLHSYTGYTDFGHYMSVAKTGGHANHYYSFWDRVYQPLYIA
jgi:hypothetical protein